MSSGGPVLSEDAIAALVDAARDGKLPDDKPAPFIVSSKVDGVNLVTVVTEGIFSYCGVKVKNDTDRHLGPERNLIRVDTHLMSDVYSEIAFDNSNNDGGQVRTATVRGEIGEGDILTSVPGHSYTNMLRDPSNPFVTNSALQFTKITAFTNSGRGAAAYTTRSDSSQE